MKLMNAVFPDDDDDEDESGEWMQFTNGLMGGK